MRSTNWGKGLSVSDFTAILWKIRERKDAFYLVLIMTHFLLKDSACSVRTSSDSGTSCTNQDEIFNWMSLQSFLPHLTSYINAQQVFFSCTICTDRLKSNNTRDFAKCNSAEELFLCLQNDFSLGATDIMTAVGRSYQQCKVRCCIRPSGLVEPLISPIL